jgi:3-isopropylmalate/(R)-2-methylmalate dehydratase small subunit
MSLPPFKTFTAIAAPLLRDNVDTDAIIPSREIKSVTKAGLAAGLFAGWRYRTAGGREPDPDFILNQAPYAAAQILLAGNNFGCGSSREHAVWALREYGIRTIVAGSFAPIFFDNCVNNGLIPAALPGDALRALADAVTAQPANPLTIDLERSEIRAAAIGAVPFAIDTDARLRLLDGLDAVDLTLRRITEIDAFQERDRRLRPWVYLAEPS